MSELERLADRLKAVERTVIDGDYDLGELSGLESVTEDIEDIESRLSELERRVAEVEASMQSIDGYVSNVESVNESVERQANSAIASVERLEGRLDELENGDGSVFGAPTHSVPDEPVSQQDATTESDDEETPFEGLPSETEIETTEPEELWDPDEAVEQPPTEPNNKASEQESENEPSPEPAPTPPPETEYTTPDETPIEEPTPQTPPRSREDTNLGQSVSERKVDRKRRDLIAEATASESKTFSSDIVGKTYSQSAEELLNSEPDDENDSSSMFR